jgi:hypothetical protein
MNARVRLSFPRNPFIFQLSQKDNSWHWCALHHTEPNWHAIFAGVFRLLGIDFTEFPDRLQLHQGSGEVAWHSCSCCTTIRLRLLKFSERKQKVVAAALLNAARHSKPEEPYANSK